MDIHIFLSKGTVFPCISRFWTPPGFFLMALFQRRWRHRCVFQHHQEEGDTDSDSNEGNGGPEEFEMLDVWRASAKAMRLGVKIDGFSLAKWWFSPGFFWWNPWERTMGIYGDCLFFVHYILCVFFGCFFTNLWGLGLYDIIWYYMLLFGIILWNRPDLGFQWIGFRESLGQKPQWYLGWCDA